MGHLIGSLVAFADGALAHFLHTKTDDHTTEKF